MTRVYLLRHAKAKNRFGWTEPDHLRPLTKSGRSQAKALRAQYGEPRLSRLLSSPYTRCVQTLEPLAESEGLSVELADALAEGAAAHGALELVRSLDGGGPAVLCTHGDVLLEALDELRSQGVPLDGPLESQKASTWIFEVDPGGIRSGRYLEPPDTLQRGS